MGNLLALHSSSYGRKPIENQVEGAPNVHDDAEAESLRTSAMPVIDDHDKPRSNAETGVVVAVRLPQEPRDDIESQDASRTPQEHQSAPRLAPADAPATRAPLALIVEDATELAEIMQATLERMSFRTIHQTHGIRALDNLPYPLPDVILLDISLPDITGWKFLDELKERLEKRDTAGRLPIIIVITAYGDPANRLIGKLQGVYSYLIKPISPDELERMVTQALSTRTL